ncbi:hypothetical protein [Kitasatospora sp. NPDC008115]|uniref:hypothetical protein n=1 Tax=Kitasatospora sp. NPDC008115 TaxID=3364022 RepID=UPI0036EE8812
MSSGFSLPPASGVGYQAVSFDLLGAAVGGSSDTVHAARLAAFARIRTEKSRYGIVNDYVATRLGLAIGAPVVDGYLVKVGSDTWAFSTVAFGEKGQRLPPADLEELATLRPWEATGIYVLDQWILNLDRHDENIGYLEKLGVAAFDHEWSLFGPGREDQTASLRASRDKRVEKHPIAEWLATDVHVSQWLRRVRSVQPEELNRHVGGCVHVGLLSREEAGALVDFLIYRQANIARYIDDSWGDFKNLTKISLPDTEVSDNE